MKLHQAILLWDTLGVFVYGGGNHDNFITHKLYNRLSDSTRQIYKCKPYIFVNNETELKMNFSSLERFFGESRP